MFKFFVFGFCFLISLLAFAGNELIVWNVGQGQWVTEVQSDTCVHYDMGGEINVTRRVLKLCQGKKNLIHLSHWDWDHISFVASFARQSFSTCLIARPIGSSSPYKERLISALQLCPPRSLASVYRTLFEGQIQKKDSNVGSSVIESQEYRTLIPGDSPVSMEKQWVSQAPAQIQGLVLGHHGSRTSTSMALLTHLPNLHWAVAEIAPSPPVLAQTLSKKKAPELSLKSLLNSDISC
jgi:competence protein ComEC